MLVEFVQVKKTVSGDYVLDNVYVWRARPALQFEKPIRLRIMINRSI